MSNDANVSGSPEEKKKKDKKKDKKRKGKGFVRGFLDVALRVLPFVGIRIPGSVKGVAKDLLRDSGVKVPTGIGGLGGGGKGVDLRDAGRAARGLGQAVAMGGAMTGQATTASGGVDTVEGISIETYARATAAMAKAAQTGGNYDQALAEFGLDLARYQRITTAFTQLMQNDASLGSRYATAYQAAMA